MAGETGNERANFFDRTYGDLGLCFFGADVLEEVEFFRSAQDDVHAVNFADFFGLQLGVTSDDSDERLGVAVEGPTHGIAAFGIGLLRDAAGVDDHHVWCVIDANARITGFAQIPGNGGRFREVQFAA